MSDKRSPFIRIYPLVVIMSILSGLAANWLSDLYKPTPVILFSLVLVVFIYSLATQTNKNTPYRGLVLFCLGALLLGALIGVAWSLPIWYEQTWHVPLAGQIMDAFASWGLPSLVGTPTVSSLELGAATTVALLGSYAALQKKRLETVAVFTIMATSGMTLAMALIKTHDIFFTFIGWAVANSLINVLASILPKPSGAFLRFFDLPQSDMKTTTSTEDSSSPSTTPSEEDAVPHATEEPRRRATRSASN